MPRLTTRLRPSFPLVHSPSTPTIPASSLPPLHASPSISNPIRPHHPKPIRSTQPTTLPNQAIYTQPWRPTTRLTRTQIDHIRFLAPSTKPEIQQIATQYEVSYEAIKRILHSKWQPTPAEQERQELKKKERKKIMIEEFKAKMIEKGGTDQKKEGKVEEGKISVSRVLRELWREDMRTLTQDNQKKNG